MSRRVLVTGGSGLVGKGIQHVLTLPDVNESHKNDEFFFLSSKDGDLRDIKVCEEVFEKFKPTHVIHLAAFVGGLFINMAKPVDLYQDNLVMNNNILQCSHKYNVDKLVSCLSTCIFPDKTTYPIDETMVHNGPPHSSNYAYAHAKRMIDVANRAYNQQYGCKFTSVIPTNIYGPNDNFHLNDSHVIPGLIRKFYDAKNENRAVTVLGTGSPVRQFIHSYDLAKLMLWTLREYDSVEPLILSVSEDAEVSIKQVVEWIAEAYDWKDGIVWDSTKADGQFKKTAANNKLLGLLPGNKFDFTSLQQGIKDTVQWFIDNHDNARL
jgi:GDP-L-fucose synthase